jgi:hypothetical protein
LENEESMKRRTWSRQGGGGGTGRGNLIAPREALFPLQAISVDFPSKVLTAVVRALKPTSDNWWTQDLACLASRPSLEKRSHQSFEPKVVSVLAAVEVWLSMASSCLHAITTTAA